MHRGAVNHHLLGGRIVAGADLRIVNPARHTAVAVDEFKGPGETLRIGGRDREGQLAPSKIQRPPLGVAVGAWNNWLVWRQAVVAEPLGGVRSAPPDAR